MAAADRSRALRAAAAVAVLPHELAHALPAAAAGLRPEITVLPAYEGDATPLGRFDADLDSETPAWVVRLVAVAPFVVYLAAAVGLRLTVAPSGAVAVAALAACAYWGSLSAGDVGVAAAPSEALSAGRFAAGVSRRVRLTADLVTVGNTLLVAAVLFV